MRAASKLLLTVGLLVGVLCADPGGSVGASGGLTVTPATLTLTLAEGKTEQTASFTITNHYDSPIELHFAFERPLEGLATDENPANILKISNTTATIAAKQTLRQVITFSDGRTVQPGGQRVDLVVTAIGVNSSNVAVRPSIRMPIILVKEAGAVSSITAKELAGGGLRLTPPDTISSSLFNDGNMITIPRGTITIVAPDGTVVGRGTVNTASQAIGRDGTLSTATPITQLANSVLPGLYQIELVYGLGGGQAERVTTKTFFYIAWWHGASLIVLAGLSYYFRKKCRSLDRQVLSKGRLHKHSLAKRGTA